MTTMIRASKPKDTCPPDTTVIADNIRIPLLSCEDDVILLRRVAAHDQQAFEVLYTRYAPRLAGYLDRRLGQEYLVDEVLNDVMLALWQDAASCPPTVSLAAWLFGIARNKARMVWRRASSSPELLNMYEDDSQDNPEMLLLHQEQGGLLARVLDALPLPQRAVIALLLEGYSQEEIATLNGIPIGTVRTRLCRAQRRLRVLVAQSDRFASPSFSPHASVGDGKRNSLWALV